MKKESHFNQLIGLKLNFVVGPCFSFHQNKIICVFLYKNLILVFILFLGKLSLFGRMWLHGNRNIHTILDIIQDWQTFAIDFDDENSEEALGPCYDAFNKAIYESH